MDTLPPARRFPQNFEEASNPWELELAPTLAI